jgi:hypothetical protein
MIGGVEVTRGGVRGVGSCGAGVSCGVAEAGAGMLAEKTGGVVGRLTCSFGVLWWCRWWMTRVVKIPSMAIALATMISRYLFDCAQ